MARFLGLISVNQTHGLHYGLINLSSSLDMRRMIAQEFTGCYLGRTFLMG